MQLEKAQQLKPDSAEVRFQRASVLRALKQYDRAREELKIFEQQKQDSVKETVAGTEANQANTYLESGDARKAVEIYREALRNDPKKRHVLTTTWRWPRRS